jgi:hypothetical protein
MAKFSELIGKTITMIERGDDRLVFQTSDGDRYVMEHEQDCCETVTLEEVIGDLRDLINSPIVEASKESGQLEPQKPDEYPNESYTWTFYKIGSGKGFVTLRWYGESNGYYSEGVSFNKNGERWSCDND